MTIYCNWPKGDLTDEEWQELVALEYVLTWGYSDDPDKDEARHKEISEKKWNSVLPPKTTT